MGKGKSRSTQTTNTIAEPWSQAQPTLERALSGLNNLYDSGQLQPAPFGSTLGPEKPCDA